MAKDDRPSKISPKVIENMRRELLGIDGAEPPKAGRFKPGQSGNPKGRPKRSLEAAAFVDDKSVHAATARIAMSPVSIKENGESISVPMVEAIIRAQMATAGKGNPLAQRDVLPRIERALSAVARERQERREFWQRYRDEKCAEIDQAKRSGKPVASPLPHPDDIVIEPGEDVRIEGPIDEADMALCMRSCLYRDTLLLQDALDERLAIPGDGYRPGGSLIWAIAFNELIYKRFQLDENQLIQRLIRNAATPKRELLKTQHRAWRTLGITAPRGTRFASFDMVEAIIRFGSEITAAILAGDIDREEFMRREFNDAALDIMERFKAKLAA
jgi:hypothetical protein